MKRILCNHKLRPGCNFLCKSGGKPLTLPIPVGQVMVPEDVVKQYPSRFFPIEGVEPMDKVEAVPAPVAEPAPEPVDDGAEDEKVVVDAPVADDSDVAPVIEADGAEDEDVDALQEEAEAMNALRIKIEKFRSKSKLDEYAAKEHNVALDRTQSLKEMKAALLDALEL